MKDNIKEDQERIIIKEEFIDDNNLIQYEYDGENDIVKVGVRYIQNRTIKENILMALTVHEYASELNKMVRINEDNTSIALFDKTKEGYVLRNCYDLQEHTFTASDFVDLEFKNKFPNILLNKFLVLTKKK